MPAPRILGIIPARHASVRFPGKILTPIGGRPLIHWVLERVSRARRLTGVLVATDDDRIREAVEAVGGRAVMTRGDHPSGTDRVAEAAAGNAEVIINIQGDEPLIDPGLIDAVADALTDASDWDMATAASPIRDRADVASPSVVKVVTARDGRALYFSRSPIPHDRDGIAGPDDAPPTYWRHLGIYGYRADALARLVAEPPCRLEQVEKLEQLRALDLGLRIRVLPTAEAGVGVDLPADVPRVEALLRKEGLLHG
jgi:3-deoxy-manno-octulosonate cytidylyltransferase (CMP-KDO synthetase)